MMRFVPVVLFLGLAVFLGFALQRDPSRIESPLINQIAPAFNLPVLSSDDTFSPSNLQGQVWVLNVFASWCTACVAEHPLLVELAAQSDIPLVGLNYKDQPSDAVAWLDRFGNPFSVVADDRAGTAGIDWGVYGVPETFVIDAAGNVRYKHIGPLEQTTIDSVLLPLIDSLQQTTAASL